MDLKNIVSRYPGVEIAVAADNREILGFYESSPMEGGSFSIRSVRSPDFFQFLRYHSDQQRVILRRDGRRALSGLAAITIRDGYVDGASEPVGYLGDLRLSFDRSTIRLWRDCYGDCLKEGGVKNFYTVVIDSNRRAALALASGKGSPFVYEPIAPYWMVNVFLRFPLMPEPFAPGIEVRPAWESDLPALRDFLDREARSRAYGYAFGQGELARRLAKWDGFSLADFVVAEEKGRIRGCFAGWSPSRAKVNVIERIPRALRMLRPLHSMVNLPREGGALHTTYLTHLEFDSSLPITRRRAVFAAMFAWYYRNRRDPFAHMVSFSDYRSESLHSGLTGYAKQMIPMTLYRVRHRDDSSPAPKGSERPGFEMALV
jgi:hypothetical protein